MNSYSDIKNFIFKKLKDINGDLPIGEIDKEIENTKKLMESVGLEISARFLSVNKLEYLSDQNWNDMKIELEKHFNVKMEKGVFIQGKEQQERDTTWWSNKEKVRQDNYYWNRYEKYMNNILPPKVIRTMDIDTDRIMDNIGNPSDNKFSIYGMVVGHVQSGKTSNYSSLICKAADSGYKFIVVIAGGLDNLRNQTQERLIESFIGYDKSGLQIGVGKEKHIAEFLPISLTTIKNDFNRDDANRTSQGINFENIKVPILLVIKKNTKTLDNVITWLKAQYKNKIKTPMLLIDDESDYASINTKVENDPTSINRKIRNLLNLFNKSSYVAFTATPYANIFIDHNINNEDFGRDLFPKDFIYSLDAPENYFGASKIFKIDDEGNYSNHLIPIDDYEEYIPKKHKKDYILSNIPNSMKEAIRLFLLNISIRSLRGQKNKHNSMLIHVTRFTAVHKSLSFFVDSYLKDLKSVINSYGKLLNPVSQSTLIRDMEDTFNKYYSNSNLNFEDVLNILSNSINTVLIREVHQDAKPPLEYRKDINTNVIAIGGTSLSRGFTLEGLSVSYFLRNTIFYDTLMQMGRWFGYRVDYEDLCKVYLPEPIIDHFSKIIDSTEDLISDFKIMSKLEMTPNNFGLCVKYHPDSVLQITSRNKLKNTQNIHLEMNLDGHLKETKLLDSNINIRNKNLDLIKKMVLELDKTYINNNNLWKDVNSSFVIEFLNNFIFYDSYKSGLESSMPINFIKKYADEINTNWDISLYSGSGDEYILNNIKIKKEKRTILEKNGCYKVIERQLSSGYSELIVFSNEEKEKLNIGNNPDRRYIRSEMKKPLLIFHILQTDLDSELAAFSISFPGGIKSRTNTIKIAVNSRYIEEIAELLEQEQAGEPDDF